MSDLYIQAGSPTEWTRPGGWVSIPSITSADTKFYGVYAVYETRKNILNIQFAGTFNITIDWGDTTTLTTASTTLISKTYTYSALTSPILVDDYGENYKTVLVTITPNTGSVTLFNFGLPTAIGTQNWLDIVMSWSTARPFFYKSHPYLQRFIQYTGNYAGALASSITLLPNCRVFQVPLNLGLPSSATQIFTYLGACEVGDMIINATVAITSLFTDTKITKFGNFTSSAATATTSIFANCTNLRFIGNVNLASSVSFGSLFLNNSSLIKIGTITSTAVTNLTSAFSQCGSLREVTFTSLANVVTVTNAFFRCFSLQKIRVPGLVVSVNFLDCAMERAELVQVFNDLGTPGTTRTITVTRNPGSADLTAADILIATSKNWIVTL